MACHSAPSLGTDARSFHQQPRPCQGAFVTQLSPGPPPTPCPCPFPPRSGHGPLVPLLGSLHNPCGCPTPCSSLENNVFIKFSVICPTGKCHLFSTGTMTDTPWNVASPWMRLLWGWAGLGRGPSPLLPDRLQGCQVPSGTEPHFLFWSSYLFLRQKKTMKFSWQELFQMFQHFPFIHLTTNIHRAPPMCQTLS